MLALGYLISLIYIERETRVHIAPWKNVCAEREQFQISISSEIQISMEKKSLIITFTVTMEVRISLETVGAIASVANIAIRRIK